MRQLIVRSHLTATSPTCQSETYAVAAVIGLVAVVFNSTIAWRETSIVRSPASATISCPASTIAIRAPAEAETMAGRPRNVPPCTVSVEEFAAIARADAFRGPMIQYAAVGSGFAAKNAASSAL